MSFQEEDEGAALRGGDPSQRARKHIKLPKILMTKGVFPAENPAQSATFFSEFIKHLESDSETNPRSGFLTFPNAI